MRSIMMPVCLSLIFASACSGGDTVTDEEAADFERQVKAEVPSMQRFTESSDFVRLAGSVCDSFESGQDYGNVSETVAAYTSLDVSSSEVDRVISIAVQSSCPDHEDKVR